MKKKIILRIVIPALAVIASAIVVSSWASTTDRSTCKESMEECKKPSNDGKTLLENFPSQLFSIMNVSN